MATVSNSADINIRVGGSTPSTILARAAALRALATSIITMNSALAAAGGGTTGGIARIGSQVAGLSRSVAALSAQFALLNRQAGRTPRTLNAYNNATQQARQRTDAFGTALRGGGNALDNFITLFSRMVRIMTAFFIIQNVTNAVKEFTTSLFQAPAQMELWNTQLRVLVGNATAAAGKMKILQDVAIESPQGLRDLVEGLVTLTAFHVETSQRTLSLITDLSAVTGRSFREVSQVVGKVIQGSPQAITRSLPVLGIDPKEFKRVAAETGSRATALFQIIEEKFKGFASESTNTILGLVEKIKDTFFVLMSQLGSGLIPIMRDVLSGMFAFADRLRNDPAAMEVYRVKVRVLAEQLLEFGRVVFGVAKAIRDLVDALGGLVTIVTLLATSWIVRLGLALASLNPVAVAWRTFMVAAAIIVGERIDHVTAKWRENRKAAMEAATANRMFGESLAETSRLAGTNISTVDANVATDQAKRLRSLAMGTDQAALVGALHTLVPEARSQDMATLQRWAFQLADAFDKIAKRARDAMGVVDTSMGEIDDIADDKIGKNAFKEDDWIKILVSFREHTKEELDKANEEWRRSIQAIVETQNRLREIQIETIEESVMDPIEDLRARMQIGLISPEAGKGMMKPLQDNLKKEIERLLESTDKDMQELGRRLAASFEADEPSSFKGALATAINNAFGELTDAVSLGMANLINPADGDKLGDQLKRAFAGFLNALGDMLIVLSGAAAALSKLLASLFSGNPVLMGTAAVLAFGAGLALKALAGAITNSIGNNQSRANSGSSSPAPNYQSFSPASQQSVSGTNVYISTMDAGGVKDFVDKNPGSFSAAVTHVAARDRQTGGSAFGVFAPAGARG